MIISYWHQKNYEETIMEKDCIVKFDPWLLGAIQKAMGKLPATPGDLIKIKSLTFYHNGFYPGEPGLLLMGWMELAPGDYSAIGKMTNLHTLLFHNNIILRIQDFGFLPQCQRLKKLDLRGTDFSDCSWLAKLPALQYALLPDRQGLIHTEVLEEIRAQTETVQERNERSRAKACIDLENQRRAENGIPMSVPQTLTGPYTADPRLIRWIAVSLGKVPTSPGNLLKVRQLDSRKVNHALDTSASQLPSWLTEKEGDFSLIGELPNLQALLLWGVDLEDFSFLAKCKELLYVNLWDTNFTDCSLLAGLERLKHIFLPDGRHLEHPSMLQTHQETWKDSYYCEDGFNDLVTVRGEDVAISYEGSTKIRHVEADFCKGAEPPLWKEFSQLRDEEDNWAKLAPKKASQLTEELTNAIVRNEVAALCLSLEPWGEGHYFILEFSGGWAAIAYMDDETPVYYQSYNPSYTGTAELSPVEFGGQTPVPKMFALEDLELAAGIVRHILETGQLLPGTLWKTS